MTNIILQKSPNEDEDEVKINMVQRSSETALIGDKRNKDFYFKIVQAAAYLVVFLIGFFIYNWISNKNNELDKHVAENLKNQSLQILPDAKNDFETLNSNLQAELDNSTKQMKALEERLLTLEHVEEQNGHLQAELDNSTKQIKALEEKLVTLEHFEQNLQADLESSEKRIKVLEEKLVTLEHVEEQNGHLQAELDSSKMQIEDLQNKLYDELNKEAANRGGEKH